MLKLTSNAPVCQVSLSARTLVTFHVVNVVDSKRQVRSGVEVVSTLARKLRSSSDAFDFRVLALNTVGAFPVVLVFIVFTRHSCTGRYC